MSKDKKRYSGTTNMINMLQDVLDYCNIFISSEGFVIDKNNNLPIQFEKKGIFYNLFVVYNDQTDEMYKEDSKNKEDRKLIYFNPFTNYNNTKILLEFAIKKYIDEMEGYDDDQYTLNDLQNKYLIGEKPVPVSHNPNTPHIQSVVRIIKSNGNVCKIESCIWEKENVVLSVFELIYCMMGYKTEDITKKFNIINKLKNRMINDSEANKKLESKNIDINDKNSYMNSLDQLSID